MKIGTTDVSKIYLGSTEVTKIYLGTTEVYSSSVEPTPPPTPQPTTGDTLVLMHFDDSTNVAAADKVADVSVVADSDNPASIDTADFKFGTGSLAKGNKIKADVTITLPETEPSVWTAECWVKGNSSKANATFSTLTKNDSAIFNGFAIIHQYNKGMVQIRTANNTDTPTIVSMTNGVLSTPDWIHIALVKLEDGTMYLGSSGKIMQVTTLPSWNNIFYIGFNKADGIGRTPCNVDEFRISKANTLKDFNIEQLTYTVPTEAFTFSGESSGGGDSGGETPTTGNNPVVYTKEKETLTIPAGVYTELDGAKRSVRVTSTTALNISDTSSLYLNVDTAKPTLIQTGSLTGNELDANIYLGKIDMSAADYTYLWVENANISFTASEESGGGESGGGSSGGGSETPAENTAWEMSGQGIVGYTKAGAEIKTFNDIADSFNYDTARKLVPSLLYTDSSCTKAADFKGDGSPIFVLIYDGSPTLMYVDSSNSIGMFGTVTKVESTTTLTNPVTYYNGSFTVPAGTYTETTGAKRSVSLVKEKVCAASDTGNLYMEANTAAISFILNAKLTGEETKTMLFLGRLYRPDTIAGSGEGDLTFEANADISYSINH